MTQNAITTTWVPASDSDPTLIPEDLKKAVESDPFETVMSILDGNKGADTTAVGNYLASLIETIPEEQITSMVTNMTSDDRAAFYRLLQMAVPDEPSDELGASLPMVVLTVGLFARFAPRLRSGWRNLWDKLGQNNAQSVWVSNARMIRVNTRNHGIERVGTATRLYQNAQRLKQENPTAAAGIGAGTIIAAVIGGDYLISKARGDVPLISSLYQGAKNFGKGAADLIGWLPYILLGGIILFVMKGK